MLLAGVSACSGICTEMSPCLTHLCNQISSSELISGAQLDHKQPDSSPGGINEDFIAGFSGSKVRSALSLCHSCLHGEAGKWLSAVGQCRVSPWGCQHSCHSCLSQQSFHVCCVNLAPLRSNTAPSIISLTTS